MIIAGPSMEIENGRDGDTNEAKSQAEEEATSSGNNRNQQGFKKSKPADEKVPFHKLFTFADTADILLMIAGTIGAAGNGLGMPLMTLLMGEMVNSFGNNQNNKHIVDVVSKVTFMISLLIYIFLKIVCN